MQQKVEDHTPRCRAIWISRQAEANKERAAASAESTASSDHGSARPAAPRSNIVSCSSTCENWGCHRCSNRRHVFQCKIKSSVFLLTIFAGPAARTPGPIAPVDTSIDARCRARTACKIRRRVDAYPQRKTTDRVSSPIHEISRFYSPKHIVSALIVMPHLTNPHSREISETTRLDAEQCQHKLSLIHI